jgi:chromosome transmission fidelity protein 1
MVKPHIFLDEADVFNINIFKLLKYITKSKIALKLKGFSEFFQKAPPSSKKDVPLEKGITGFLNSLDKKQKTSQAQKEPRNEAEAEAKPKVFTGTPLLSISELLKACVDAKSEGKILISCRGTLAKSSIKYCLLNPSSPFQDLVQECRAIVVAGGTMQPISEFKDQLFVSAGASVERVTHFSCGHVIPKENILPIVLQRGPSGRELDFTFTNRDRQETMDELYSVLSNCSNVIPGGVVCFFPCE